MGAHPIPTAFYGHVESDLGTAKAVEAHWEKGFSETSGRQADQVTRFKERLQTVKMPAGGFKAYVMKERFAEIFQKQSCCTIRS